MRIGEALARMDAIRLDSLPSGPIVYFVRSCGLVKIGHTTNASKRLRVLETQNAAPVDVVAFGVGATPREQSLHARFEGLRHHGEWFTPSPDLLRVMASAIANGPEWQSIEAEEEARLREWMRQATIDQQRHASENASQGLLD